MTSEEMEKIYFEVKRHYDGTDHPYYLSELGGFMRRNDISKPHDTPLKDYLSNYFKDRLPIVQDPLVRARVAIATPELKQRVAERQQGFSYVFAGEFGLFQKQDVMSRPGEQTGCR